MLVKAHFQPSPWFEHELLSLQHIVVHFTLGEVSILTDKRGVSLMVKVKEEGVGRKSV